MRTNGTGPGQLLEDDKNALRMVAVIMAVSRLDVRKATGHLKPLQTCNLPLSAQVPTVCTCCSRLQRSDHLAII